MELTSVIDFSVPTYSKNLTNVDVNWLTQPYLPQHPRTHRWTLLIFAVLYAIYIRLWFINRAVFGIEEFRKNNSFIWFLTVLNYMNFFNCLSSVSMINVRLDSTCDGIYTSLDMFGLVITSILSDCTYRSMIWFLIIICVVVCLEKLNKKLIIGSAIIITTIFLVSSTLIRTISIRYDYNVNVEYLRLSCLNGCCASGVIQIIPKNLASVFEVLKTVNDYINLVTVLAMILLIPLLLVTLANSITKRDRSIVMIFVRIQPQCDGIYYEGQIGVILLASIISDSTFRTVIWLTIFVSFMGRFLETSLVNRTALGVSLSLTAWATIIRTVAIRYSATGTIQRYSCINTCCTYGYVQHVPENLSAIFNKLKLVNQYLNLLSVALMAILVLIQLVFFVNSLMSAERTKAYEAQLLLLFNLICLSTLSFSFIDPFSKELLPESINERIHNLAIWTPMLMIIVQYLQLFSVNLVFPIYKNHFIQIFKMKNMKNKLCCK
ncbi:unnamed protein product [Caenorhabditis brenneri]